MKRESWLVWSLVLNAILAGVVLVSLTRQPLKPILPATVPNSPEVKTELTNARQKSAAVFSQLDYGQQPGAEDAKAALRRNFPGLNLTEAQVNSLLKADRQHDARQKELDSQLDAGLLSPAGHGEKVEAMETAKEQSYQEVLGADAYAGLQRQRDERYEMIKRQAADLQLDGDDINFVYDAVSDYQKRVTDYKRRAQMVEEQGQTVDWDGVRQNLAQFILRTDESLENHLGPDRFNLLVKSHIVKLDE